MTPEEIKADKRLQRTYGITLAEYNQKLVDQNGCCAICHRPPTTVRLAVDHDHRFDRAKIVTRKPASNETCGGKFGGFAEGYAPNGKYKCMYAKTRKFARDAVRRLFRCMSVRGLLCMNCNRGLQKFYDRPERFERAAQYLRKFEESARDGGFGKE